MKNYKIRDVETLTIKALIITVLIVITSCSSNKTVVNNSQPDYVEPKGISENNPYQTHNHTNNLYNVQTDYKMDAMVKNGTPLRKVDN